MANLKLRNRVLDNFINTTFIDKWENWKTKYEEFQEEKNLNKEVLDMIDFILKKITKKRLWIFKKVNYDKFENWFWVLFWVLSQEKVFQEVLNVLTRIYIILYWESNIPKTQKLLLSLLNKWFSHKDLAEIEFKNGLQTLELINEYYNDYILLFWKTEYIIKIWKMYEWDKKLIYLKQNWKKIIKLINFNGYHLSKIVLWLWWEDKLKYFEDDSKLQKLQNAWFNASHLAQIVKNAWWEEKLKYFENNSKLQKLQSAWFNGYHLAQIVKNAWWEKKLEYILKNINKLTCISKSQIAKICLKKDWKKIFEGTTNK